MTSLGNYFCSKSEFFSVPEDFKKLNAYLPRNGF